MSNIFSLLLIFILIQILRANECPTMQSFHNVLSSTGYVVRSFLRIPNTNILLINTISLSNGSSIVYFNDLATSSGEIIGVVNPDYNILEMSYIQSLDMILVINSSIILQADPYTLVAKNKLSIEHSQSLYLVKNTKYAIVTMQYNEISILDTISLKILKILSNINQLNTSNYLQHYSQVYTLKNSTDLIMCSNEYGVFTWSINFNTLNAQYNGYIDAVNVVEPNTNRFRTFDKHPVEDVFFFSGNHSQIVIVKLIDLKKRVYLTMLNSKMYNGTTDVNSFNIIYKEPIISNEKQPMLIIGNSTNLFYLPIVINNDSVTINNLFTPDKQTVRYHQYRWFQFEEGVNRFVMASNNSVTIFDINTKTSSSYLYDEQRRTMYQNHLNDMFVTVSASQIQLSLRSSPGDSFNTNIPQLVKPIYFARNSLNRVKLCEECLLIRVGISGQPNTHYITTSLIYPYGSPHTNIALSSLSLNWEYIGQNLDPYFYDSSVWVVLSFPTSIYSPSGYLFLLVNASSGQTYELKVGPDDPNGLNSNISSFAIVSIENTNEMEIIGVDRVGNIYIWGISDKKFKGSYQIKNCYNAEIGDVFHFGTNKWLVTVCDDLIPIVYDFSQGTTTKLTSIELFSIPLALKAYSSLGIIVITDFSVGDTYIYKLDTETFIFNPFMSLLKGKLKDTILAVELLKDNTLWIQYTQSNTFFELPKCIEDVTSCTYCSQSFYFNASETYNSNGIYGYGNETLPYTGSANYYATMVKAQSYYELVGEMQIMQVNINVSPDYPIKLRAGLLECDFSSVISLHFQSNVSNSINSFQSISNININVETQLVFSGYNQVGLKDANLNFTNPSSTTDSSEYCGLGFNGIIDKAVLQSIKINIPECSFIVANSTNLEINSLQVENQNFTEHGPLIEINNSKQLNITNLLIKNVIFGNNTSIVSSGSDLELRLTDIIITQSSCPTDEDQPNTSQISIPLFSAGLIKANGLEVSDNTFCKKNILLSATSLEQENLEFELHDVFIKNNQFEATSEQLFFSALYSQRVVPSHTIQIKNVTFLSNNLFQKKDSNEDLVKATMIIINKIKTISFNEIRSINQNSISIAKIDQSFQIEMNLVTCLNDSLQISASPATLDPSQNGCFALSEIKSLEISGLQIQNKITYDAPIVSLSNVVYDNANLIIKTSSFSDLQMIQTLSNTNASPIMIQSINSLDIKLESCTFENNSLIGPSSSFTYSTTGFWIENFVGTVSVNKSSFLRSSSNSRYNFIFVSSRSVDFSNSTFSEQSFDSVDSSVIKGGFMHLQSISININGCSFSKSRAGTGSFIYSNAFGEELTMNIKDSFFEEGFALADGGAIFVNMASSILKFDCENCLFNNIFTLTEGASTIAFYSEQNESSRKHSAIFSKGKLINWSGIGSNYFSNFSNFYKFMISFEEITSENFTSNSLSYLQLIAKNNNSQGSLLNSVDSAVFIHSSIISNLYSQGTQDDTPLIITASNSEVTINNVQLANFAFNRAAIEVFSGNLTLQSTEFTHLSQSEQNLFRILESDLDELLDKFPITKIYSSLIILHNSQLQSLESSNFTEINCSIGCNGSILQLLNSTFSISNTNISTSMSNFGGSIFISDLRGINSIKSSYFTNNTAIYSGGSIYLLANSSDFSFSVDDCSFEGNKASYGRGGAIFIRSEVLNNLKQSITIEDSFFIKNIAQIAGSIDSKDIYLSISNTTTIEQNIGLKFGNSTISYPSQLSIINQNEVPNLTPQPLLSSGFDMILNDFQSGSDMPKINFAFLSEKGELVYPITQSELSSFSIKVNFDSSNQMRDNYQIRGISSVYFDASTGFSFKDLQLVGKPETSATLLFGSSQIFVYNPVSKLYTNDYLYRVNVVFRKCNSGEKKNSYSTFTECQTCAKGKYSYDLKECYDCPIGATCNGGDNLVVNPGYWRLGPESDQVLFCSNNESFCVGGVYGNLICEQGHIGALCEECDILGEYWTKNYTKQGKYQCIDCDDIPNNIWKVIAIILWTFISMILAIRGDINYLESNSAGEALNRRIKSRSTLALSSISQQNPKIKRVISFIDPKNLISNSQPQKKTNKNSNSLDNKTGVYIKNLTNYLQIIRCVATFNLSIPSGLFDYPSSIGEPVQLSLSSLDCGLKNISTSIPMIYLRLIFSQLIPCIYIIIFLIGIVIQYRKYILQKKFPIHILSTAILFFIIYVQPDLVSQSISLISCREIGGKYYILSNVSYECYTETYITYTSLLVIPLLLVWVIILPVFLFIMLKKNQQNLSNLNIKLIYGFLYKEYKEEAFYWEFVKMAQKLAIILTLNLYSQRIVMKGILIFIIITIYKVIALIIQPYKDNSINQLDEISTNVSSIIVLLAVFIYNNKFDYLVYPAFIFIVIANFWYFLVILKPIGLGFLDKLKERAKLFTIPLQKRFPNLERFFKKEPLIKVNNPIRMKIKALLLKLLELSFEQKKAIFLHFCEQDLGKKYEIEIPITLQSVKEEMKIEPLSIEMINSIDQIPPSKTESDR